MFGEFNTAACHSDGIVVSTVDTLEVVGVDKLVLQGWKERHWVNEGKVGVDAVVDIDVGVVDVVVFFEVLIIR